MTSLKIPNFKWAYNLTKCSTMWKFFQSLIMNVLLCVCVSFFWWCHHLAPGQWEERMAWEFALFVVFASLAWHRQSKEGMISLMTVLQIKAGIWSVLQICASMVQISTDLLAESDDLGRDPQLDQWQCRMIFSLWWLSKRFSGGGVVLWHIPLSQLTYLSNVMRFFCN